MERKQRIVLLVLAAVVAAVALVVVGTGDGDDEDVIDTRTTATVATTTTPTIPTVADPTLTVRTNPTAEPAPAVPEIVLRDGKPVGGAEKLRFRKGGDIVFVVRSDADGEIHLHGYDIAKDVEAGKSVRFEVPAAIDGSFEVEVEDTGALIAEVEVVP